MRKYDGKSNVIGNTLRKIRQKNNYSQTDLCRRLELIGITIAKEDLSKIENNNKTVKDFEVWALAKALDISLEELFEELNKEVQD